MSAALWLFGKVLVAWLALSACGLLVWVAVVKCRGVVDWEDVPDTATSEAERQWCDLARERTADLQRKAVGE